MSDQHRYRTYAYFYKYDSEQACRKYLDIKRNGRQLGHPELVILMAQPSGCDNADDIWEQEIEIPADSMVLRIQEFMNRHGLRWVRVLSLSDVQGKWDDAFFKSFEGSGDKVFPPHSIFHVSRADELGEYSKTDTPFLLTGAEAPRARIVANAAVKHMREKGFRIIDRSEGPSPKGRAGKKSSWIDEADANYKWFVDEQGQLEPDKEKSASGGRKNKDQAEAAHVRAALKRFVAAEPPHLLITSAKVSGKWALFAGLLGKKKLVPYTGTKNYDYIFADHVMNTRALAELLRRHNGKRIILDSTANPKMLAAPGALKLLQAATGNAGQGQGAEGQNNLDPGSQANFRFTGQLLLLTDNPKDELMRSKPFAQLLKNWLVV